MSGSKTENRRKRRIAFLQRSIEERDRPKEALMAEGL